MIIKGQATVVKHTGSHYMLSALPGWELFPAVLRGKIRLKGSSATNPVAVGDMVGKVAKPTIYYAEEGSNVYFKMTKDGTPVNPLDRMGAE